MAHARRAFVNYRKLALMVLASVLVYNEFLSYLSAYTSWPSRQDGPNWRSVLLVADPQLQGYRGEPAFPLGAVTRWDSDRFLRKTFAWARSYYRLDAVIFLGDLIDEGSTADDDDFADYVSRFFSIYPEDASDTMIFTSGDNDIGGEGVEAVSEERIRRFRKHFPERPVTRVKGIPQLEVVTVNVLAMQIKNSTDGGGGDPFKGIPPKKGLRFVVSHIPLSPPSQSPFAAGIINILKPDVIFSAHYHRGVHVVSGEAAGEITNKATFFRHAMEAPVVLNFTKERDVKTVHEIIVPTCSYRMGEREMAFGLASVNFDEDDLDSSSMMIYQNLWLPKRFPMIFLYISAVAVAFLLLCIGKCRQPARKAGSRRSSGSGDSQKQI